MLVGTEDKQYENLLPPAAPTVRTASDSLRLWEPLNHIAQLAKIIWSDERVKLVGDHQKSRQRLLKACTVLA